MFMEMSIYEFASQYRVSKEEEDKEKLWSLYVNLYPNFDKNTFVPFNQFFEEWYGKKTNKKKISSNGKTSEELIAEAENILFNMEFMEQ